jgi:hypothetical protein
MCVNAGMWFERFVIIVVSIHRDFLPSSWGMFYPTWVDKVTFVGTFGLFLSLFLLFIRFLPMIAIAEVKGVTPHADSHSGHGHSFGYSAGPQSATGADESIHDTRPVAAESAVAAAVDPPSGHRETSPGGNAV